MVENDGSALLFHTCSYVPRYFESEPEDLAQWDGRPKLTEAGRQAMERDFKAEYP